MRYKREKVETKAPEEAPEETPQEKSPVGIQELYFFPNYQKVVMASSLQEANRKIKEGEE